MRHGIYSTAIGIANGIFAGVLVAVGLGPWLLDIPATLSGPAVIVSVAVAASINVALFSVFFSRRREAKIRYENWILARAKLERFPGDVQQREEPKTEKPDSAMEEIYTERLQGQEN